MTNADFSTTEHPNLQLALDAVLGDAELLGYSAPMLPFHYAAALPVIAVRRRARSVGVAR